MPHRTWIGQDDRNSHLLVGKRFEACRSYDEFQFTILQTVSTGSSSPGRTSAVQPAQSPMNNVVLLTLVLLYGAGLNLSAAAPTRFTIPTTPRPATPDMTGAPLINEMNAIAKQGGPIREGSRYQGFVETKADDGVIIRDAVGARWGSQIELVNGTTRTNQRPYGVFKPGRVLIKGVNVPPGTRYSADVKVTGDTSMIIAGKPVRMEVAIPQTNYVNSGGTRRR